MGKLLNCLKALFFQSDSIGSPWTKDTLRTAIRKASGIMIQRGESPAAPLRGEFGISIPKLQPLCQITQPRAASTGSFTWRQNSGPHPNPLPAEQHTAPAALAGLFPLAAWGFSCPKPTHQHGPAAKHAMEPWHGSWTLSPQELFVIQQPQISQLHSDFTREERQWCALILACSAPLFPF